MVLRWLFHYLVNNEQLINRLADSYPVRKTARFVVNMFVIGRDTFGKLTGPSSITERYEEKLREAAEALKKAQEAGERTKKKF